MGFHIDRGCTILVYSGLHLSMSRERHVRVKRLSYEETGHRFLQLSPIGDAAVMFVNVHHKEAVT